MSDVSWSPRYSIIVATLNEQATIRECVERILAIYPDDCEILVINGGNDATGTIVEQLAAGHPDVRHVRNRDDRGKGHAVRVGIALARAPIQAQIDADLQFLPEELPRLIAPIAEGSADVVLGSRFTTGSARQPGSTPAIRTLGNKAVSGYASLLFGQRMTDVQAGLKAWSTEAIRRVALRSDNYSYEVEIPAKALRCGLRVMEVAITTAARHAGDSNVTPLRAGLALLRDISLFRLGWK